MDIDIRTLLARLNPTCKQAMTQAAELCVRQTHFHVDVEHLLVHLLDAPAPDLALVLPQFGIARDIVLQQLHDALAQFKRGNGRTPALSPRLAPLFQEAWLLSSMLLGEQQIRSGTLVLALLEIDSLRGQMLETAPALLQIPRGTLRDALTDLLAASAESTHGVRPAAGYPTAHNPGATYHLGTDADAPQAPGGHGHAVGATPSSTQPTAGMPTAAGLRRSATPSLDQYTLDLTAQAREGRIDPILGRDAEIRQIIDILLRRRQNNPILTGEAGVGKTAVVEGFAQRVVQGKVPAALQGVSVRALDLALLQAGAGIKGEFENRLKSVIAEVKGSPTPIILFIDEAHQLIGAGGAEGQGDAANLLKPALARGELRTIAATTWAEYKKYVERDPALARRFQTVKVDEPDTPAAVLMLRGIVPVLERHHGVDILDEAVHAAVTLSTRYVSGRQLPDKAISVLDTACARVAVGQSGLPEALQVLDRDIAATESELSTRQRELATRTEPLIAGQPDPAQACADLREQLQSLQQQRQQLADKHTAEHQAVTDIVALRRQLASAQAAHDSSADQLQQRMQALRTLQGGSALVPIYVDATVVADVIADWTGIPVGRMLSDEVRTVLQLKEALAQRVVGQDAALDTIARRVRTFRADLDQPGKPVGVFLLVGPSGVGKTETAVALAELLYGGERNLIVVNMSEFQEPHAVSSLKGAPPGYVGYGRGGVLTEAVRRRPYSVVLLDEIEKAHPDVLDMFFQVFDKGTLDDGEGTSIDFSNTLILLTSNASQDLITSACNGLRPPDPDTLCKHLRPALLRQFSPAFLGRMVLVPYYPLGDSQIQRIVTLKLNKLAQRMHDNHRAQLLWDDAVVRRITARCTEVDSGARNIDFILTQSVLPELATQVLERVATQAAFDTVQMTVDRHGRFVFAFSAKAEGQTGGQTEVQTRGQSNDEPPPNQPANAAAAQDA